MGNLTDQNLWTQSVRQIEPGDSVIGGANAPINLCLAGINNRTVFLKTELAKAVASIGSNKTEADTTLALKADKTRQISVGAGLTGGGDLTANRIIGLATPSTLSGSTTNWVGNGTTGHTHQLAAATATVAGVAKLIDGLNSDDGTAALSARQGKELLKRIADANPVNRASVNLDTQTSPIFFSSATASAGLPTTGDYGGLVIGHNKDCTQIVAEAGTLWLRGSDANPISQASDWTAWKRILDENIGVMLTGNQSIGGNKTFTGSLKATSVILADAGIQVSHSSKDKWATFGMSTSDVYINNPTSNKYLQLKDDGTLAYSNDQILLYSDRSDAVNLDSTAKIATSKAVKTVYDKAIAIENAFAKNHAANGYQKLPNGLIIQWGVFNNVRGDSYNAMTFPIAFPNVCLNVQTTVSVNGPVWSTAVVSSHAGNISKTGCSLGVSENGVSAAMNIYWFAIGY